MTDRRLGGSSPGQLSTLLNLDEQGEKLWQPAELAAVLRHQLTAPLQVDLSNLARKTGQEVKLLAEASGLVLKSFADLLAHPNPPVELLVLAKDYAKACKASLRSPLPSEVAEILYYAAIVSARLRAHRNISSLTDEQLGQGVAWALSCDWLDETTRSLFQESAEKHPLP
jgi:hypothetical protein